MKIISLNKKFFIEIKNNIENDFPSFKVLAEIDINHGVFSAKNNDLALLNINEFRGDLDAFIINRELQPRLEGTYDSFIEFSKGTEITKARIKFAIGDAYSGFTKTVNFLFTGEFEIEIESISKLLRELKAL